MKTTRQYCITLSRLSPSFLTVFAILILSCCSPVPDQRLLLKDDLRPPVFIAAELQDSRNMSIEFSEPVTMSRELFTAVPELPLASSESSGNALLLTFGENMEPGREYSIELTVEDEAANSHTLLVKVYGFNPRVPELILNEITTQGSTANPDKVELKALSSGNTAGVAVYEGTIDFWDQLKVLPPVEVQAGDYLVLHFKPVGTTDEIDETTSKIDCMAEDASDYGWDFWLEGGSGLSGNNGVVSVYTHTAGELLDGFLYSNRTSSSDEDYRGFGSAATMEKADQLWLQGGWEIAGRLPAPEDAVNPDDSTATRSMGRLPGAADSDSSADWQIVDTGESSFGYENSTLLYTP